MIELVVTSFMALVSASLYYFTAQGHRALQRLWTEAAHRAGLSHIARRSEFRFGVVTAEAGRMSVAFRRYQRGKDETYETGTELVIAGDSGLTLRREGGQSGFEWMTGVREIELGDAAFDDMVWVVGAPAVARAVLDPVTRSDLLMLLGGAVRVAGQPAVLPVRFWTIDGSLVAEISMEDGGDQPTILAGAIKSLVEMARRLQVPADLPGRLAQNLRAEPEWMVRVHTLRLLAESYPRHSGTLEVLKECCRDEREEVQLAAALALGGEEGNRVLTDIATREWSVDACAARAVGGLRDALPRERVLSVLSHALRTRRVKTAEACIESLGASGGSGVVEALARVLAIESGELAVAAAHALGASRGEGAEPALLRALERSAEEVRVAAAESLGRAGTARSVPPLKDVAAANASGAALRRAARQAVGEIQARLQGVASPGQLSLSEARGQEGGEVSLAGEDPRGQVSMSDDEARGRVSLSGPRKGRR